MFAPALRHIIGTGVLGLSASLLMAVPALAEEEAALYFIEPVDGQTVTGPLTVKFGLRGMGVAPAGVQVDNTGHHHLLVDIETLPDLTMPLPKTEQILHFGAGQTETVLNLPAGTHTLQLILGNFAHIPHAKPLLSEKITVTVE
jgi:hypothetical protein